MNELAAAVAVEQPELLASQFGWAKTALAGRGVSPDHLRSSVAILARVLSQELPEPVRPLAARYLSLAVEAVDQQAAGVSELQPGTPFGRLTAAYLLALLEGDRRRASRMIVEAADHAGTVRDIYLQVLMPAQAEIGRMWQAGEANVAEGHFASHTTKMVMAQLLSRAPIAPPNGKTMMAAAVAGNQHDIGLFAVGDFFEMEGWRTVQLGADVPAADLAQAVECFDVDLIALSATLHVQLETVKSTIRAVRSAPRGGTVKILAGGLAFSHTPSLAEELGADAYAATPDDALRIGARLVGLPPADDAG